ncbi:lipase family protein [Nocardioides aurantiacus]|uniref:Secretory lipase n=1 Tax=Nocardioides aurantiacus TaxID=86796 RepID=A0A3N2CQH8_9ACTN|nr:lipase family protein [Nocardioides aurantiacus]ROR89739.1 secretory lipase [Nocardioides aurantiacus]
MTPHPRTRRRLATSVVASVAALATPAALLATAPTATAAAPTTAVTAAAGDDAFYTPPATLDGAPGTVIRSEPSAFYLDPARTLRADADVQRVMYVSTDRNGERIPVTGSVLTPRRAWSGPGERPVVSFAVGTQGLGDQCAPSRQLNAGTEYEGGFVKGLLSRGYGIAVTDYEGLGTPGTHTYVSREVTGRATLDVVRAAQSLPAANLPDAGPVALTGYSQGGGATAAAGEIAASYAPELRLKGVVAGAVPGDLKAVAANLDGSPYFAFLGYAVAGLAASYDIDTDPYLNTRGEQVLEELEGQCTVESVARYPFTRSTTLTEDGRPLTAYLDEPPFDTVVAEQKIADGRKPAVPTLVTQSLGDDVIPFKVGRDVARRWCALGAKVRFAPNAAITHVAGAAASYPESFAFLEARFRGIPALSNCGAF